MLMCLMMLVTVPSLQSSHAMAKTCSSLGLYPPCEELSMVHNIYCTRPVTTEIHYFLMGRDAWNRIKFYSCVMTHPSPLKNNDFVT